MMLGGLMFAFWRFLEIITLIPTFGMLAWFVHQYSHVNALTPNYILVLFIVSVLAAAWAIATLFTYHRARSNAFFVAFVDLCFVGAFIAGVYELRGIAHANCSHVSRDHNYAGGLNFGFFSFGGSITGLDIHVNKECAMLKSSFAFGIMNTIFFAITSLLALLFGRRDVVPVRKETYVRETHVSRTGHRRSGSHRSHQSSHSGRRRAYV